MAFLLEDGTGIQGANTMVPVSFVDTYLAERGRSTENGWTALTTSAKQIAIVKACDYISTRWEARLKGVREFRFTAVAATATVTLTAQSAPGDVLTIDGVEFDMDLGADLTAAAAALVDAINASSLFGLTLATTTSDGAVVTLTAYTAGVYGNYLTITDGTSGDVTVVDFAGGLDGGLQGTAFPRAGLADSAGGFVTGIPFPVRAAVAEYAVRAVAAALIADPTVDASGKVVVEKSEQVGPIVERTKFSEGGVLDLILTPYPAADLLLTPYLKSAGVTR